MHTRRIGLWIAVSSQPQTERTSLSDQRRLGEEFAAAVSGEVVRVYEIAGFSRDFILWTEAEQHVPEYRALRLDLEAGNLDVLWAYDSDRLGRSAAIVQQVLGLCERHGCEPFLSTTPHALGQPSVAQKYVAAIQAVRAGEDQALRKHRHRSGMRGRVEKRGLLPGKVPFWLSPLRDPTTGETVGYEFSEKAGALDLMTELFLSGLPYQEIIRRLDRSGYRPPNGGRHWWSSTLHDTLDSDVPAGIAHWGGSCSVEPIGRIPSRWDHETYEAVKAERQRRKAMPGYVRVHASALTRVAFCARCGSPMARLAPHGRGYAYLRCGHHTLRYNYPDLACHPNYIREDAVLAELARFLDTLTTPEVIDEALAQLDTGTDETRLRQDLDTASDTIRDIDQRRQRLAHALAAGQLDLVMYRATDDELLSRLSTQQKRQSEIASELAAIPNVQDRRERLASLAADWQTLMADNEPAAVSRLLRLAGIRILIENGCITTISLG